MSGTTYPQQVVNPANITVSSLPKSTTSIAVKDDGNHLIVDTFFVGTDSNAGANPPVHLYCLEVDVSADTAFPVEDLGPVGTTFDPKQQLKATTKKPPGASEEPGKSQHALRNLPDRYVGDETTISQHGFLVTGFTNDLGKPLKVTTY